ncbi:hypothetical protein ACFCYH_16815 [Streptomyces sp. NPDC056400]|uniref:hypothetical protein n=1 Tax=Streptomyces sp. NPDC056400 TaxID=3345808 RepID=UPI0035DCDE79
MRIVDGSGAHPAHRVGTTADPFIGPHRTAPGTTMRTIMHRTGCAAAVAGRG